MHTTSRVFDPFYSNFDVLVSVGSTNPLVVRIEVTSPPHDPSTTIIIPTLTVGC